jgi:tetratricopeptide (TPR) repeat protein
MSRTTLYKGIYFGMAVVAGAISLAILLHYHFSPTAIVAVVVALLLPGRILGYFWRDLLRGLRLLNAREFTASKICSQRFLAELPSKPWLKYLVWLGASSYSRDPEALALNNLGAAEIQLGELGSARQHLDRAIEIDPLCPLPYLNIGALLEASGNADEARLFFDQAARLGYKRDISDKIVIAAQTRFANTDGSGRG